jgi:hypothetical protein
MAKRTLTAAGQYTDPVRCDSGIVSISIKEFVTLDMTIVMQRRRPGGGASDWRTFAVYSDNEEVEETSNRMAGSWDVRAGTSAWTSGTAEVEIVV